MNINLKIVLKLFPLILFEKVINFNSFEKANKFQKILKKLKVNFLQDS